MLGQSKSSAPQKLQRELKMTCGTCTKTGFAPNCDFPVRASQGQPFATISPQNLERQAQPLATIGHFQRSSRAAKGPIASISTISSLLFSWQVSLRHGKRVISHSIHQVQQVHLHKKAALIFHWVEIMHVVTLLH